MLKAPNVEGFYAVNDQNINVNSELRNTVADQLIRNLAANGINTYFGIPGGSIEPLFNALAREERQGNVTFTLTRSEAAAGFAADGYYRSSGDMAVCTGTAGPGISNMLTSIMSAHADRIPLLVIVPEVTSSKLGRGALQDSSIDGHNMSHVFSECTKYCSVITDVEQLVYKIKKALIHAWTPPMGPSYLAIPTEILSSEKELKSFSIDKNDYNRKTVIDLYKVQQLINKLLHNKNKKIVFYLGDDAGFRVNELNKVAGLLNARIIASPAGKRWINHYAENYYGVAGFSGSSEALEIMQNADTIVCLGATFDELSTNAWEIFGDNANIYCVDSHLDYSYRINNMKSIASHPDMFVEHLLKNTSNFESSTKNFNCKPDSIHSTNYIGDLFSPVHPKDLMAFSSENIPDDVVVHLDVGNTFSWSTNYFLRRNIDTYRVSLGLSTMCWSIASIIGSCISSGKRSICMVGDGAMLMSSLELTVAVENNLPVTYIILNDSSLGMVRHGQILAKAESFAHKITSVNFATIAHSVGAEGIKIHSLKELLDIPKTWLENNKSGPCVIDIDIDKSAVPPMADRVAGLAMGVPK